VDADLQPVAGFVETPNTPNSVKALPQHEVAILLNQELAAWAHYVDNTMDKKNAATR
jgi:hypothetical protein